MTPGPKKLSELSRQNRMEFLYARFVAYHSGHKPIDRAKLQARLHRWSYYAQAKRNASRRERFGLDVTGHGAADYRRKLRNARKAERAAS